MNTRSKILEALGDVVDDISEERLLDILLDSYAAKKQRIKELESENAHERQMLQSDREDIQIEHRNMRNDPLYCARGRFYFLVNSRAFVVDVQGFRISMFERIKGTDYLAIQLSPDAWEQAQGKP